MNTYWNEALKIPPDRPTILCATCIAIGLLFAALYLRDRLHRKPMPPALQLRREVLPTIVSSRQFWFAAIACGLIGTSTAILFADAFGYCKKTAEWSWECQAGGAITSD